MKKLAVILGVILIVFFLITWGIGWIPGMTGRLDYNIIALAIGIILLIYGLVKE